MTICKHVIYSGRVQGVGFRFTVHHLAEGYTVAGFVRNLPSGEVELLAEGSAEDVDAFLAAVAKRMAGYIRRAEVRDESPAGLQRFEIRY
jgi:acylphosphatase